MRLNSQAVLLSLHWYGTSSHHMFELTYTEKTSRASHEHALLSQCLSVHIFKLC